MIKTIAYLLIFLVIILPISAQQINPQQAWWHGKERDIHYQPDGNNFVCVNGKMRFNRALYGTNTGFRVEAGDLPEFALYMPGMGGNLKFGLINGTKSKWLIEAKNIKATYQPGSMLYEIQDELLGKGKLYVTVLALADAEGIIVKVNYTGTINNTQLMWMYGGATGKKFSRDGDIGADPESSFYLQPAYCKGNSYKIEKNIFTLSYGAGKVLTEEEQYEIKHLTDRPQQSNTVKKATSLIGIMPVRSSIKLVDAGSQQNPNDAYRSSTSSAPAIAGILIINAEPNYFLVHNAATPVSKNDDLLPTHFAKAAAARKILAEKITLVTPDKYLNTLGGALGIAADAIWEDPSYMHGAVAWRMRLNAWRGAYVADPLGWHDRAEKHFSSYALSQLTTPAISGVVMDTALHLARHLEKLGTALFSDGYICRNPNGDFKAHHYDMNLVFIDALLNHFNYTGDLNYVKKMWPLLKRHLAWEKRNFDTDGDGLYDAYAAIWASDALQYSGGGVTHTSAYNYRANIMAAQLAKLIGEDGTIYEKEAIKIYNAIDKNLWMPQLGWYAEYKDLLGNQLVHPIPGIWTIYHTIDSKVPDPFKAYQTLQFLNTVIPHIPVKANGLPQTDLSVIPTTNWQPYTWSLNNVALAENLHTALAYWQGGQSAEAYHLWKSAIIESMYLSASPGGFQQLSFYDAIRSELYRDFADPIAMVARTLVEGLFGIQPNALKDSLIIEPGFPADWKFASLKVPDISIDFKKDDLTENYTITSRFNKKMKLQLKLKSTLDGSKIITVNGKSVPFTQSSNAINQPIIIIDLPYLPKYNIKIISRGEAIEHAAIKKIYAVGESINVQYKLAKVMDIFDPQKVLNNIKLGEHSMQAVIQTALGDKTFFVHLKQGQFIWWQPVCFAMAKYQDTTKKAIQITDKTIFEKIDLTIYFNDKVTNVFKQQYLSPRPKSPTMQLPVQGIGNWCYPLITAAINDFGTRQLASKNNEISTPENVPFTTPADSLLNNIMFTSQWDNYPKEKTIALSGAATQLHLLMAGSTNAMQSRFVNGAIIVQYKDASSDTLQLINPQNWWPIEQDYYTDGVAFTTDAPMPLRLYLKDGKFAYGLKKYTSIKGFSNQAIDGGAATVLIMPLNANKQLQSITLKTIANDVVIGLMSVTLQRN